MMTRGFASVAVLFTTVSLVGALALEGRATEPPGNPVLPEATQPLISPCGCLVDDSLFASGDGGCQDLQTGLVWSSWSYNGSVSSALDWQGAVSYCDNLVECGYDDWYLPSKDEALAAAANGTATHVDFNVTNNQEGFWQWTSDSVGKRAWVVYLTQVNGLAKKELKGGKGTCVCARITTGPPPAAIDVFTVSPGTLFAGTSNSFTITGGGFVAGAAVTFENGKGPAPSASNVAVLDPFTLTVDLSVAGGGKPGTRTWDVRVTNTDQSTGALAGGLLVVK